MAEGDHTIVTVSMPSFETTGLGYLVYARRYREAAVELDGKSDSGIDPVVYQLYCQSLELYLKAFIWLSDRKTQDKIKSCYRHDLEKLWRHSKDRGISKYVTLTELRDQVIQLVGPLYKARRFAYFDLAMVLRGRDVLRSEPRSIPTLRRLTARLEETLRPPILEAS